MMQQQWEKHSSSTMVSLIVACAILFTTDQAVGAPSEQKIGADYEKQGEFFRAAQSYVRALRHKPKNSKVRRALERTADRAIDEKLRRAMDFESASKIDEAIAELDAATRLGVQFDEFGIDSEQARTVASARTELIARRINALSTEADHAMNNGMWSAAIAQLKRAEVLRPGSEEIRNRLYDAWSAWAEMNFSEGRIRAAVERLEEAAKLPVPRSKIAAERAANIRIDLGKSALNKGACRAAVADFRNASKQGRGVVPQELLHEATACATTCVKLSVSADPDADLAADQLARLQSAFRAQLSSDATEFLRLPNPNEADTACTGRTMPGVDGKPMKVGPYRVSLRVNNIQIVRQPATSVTRRTRDHHSIGVETTATFEEYRDSFTGKIGGWLTITDIRATDATTVPLPVRATGQATARWQGTSASSVTSENMFTGQRSTAVMISSSPGGKTQAEQERRRARSELTEILIRNIAEQATKTLLSTLDVEPSVTDPSRLTYDGIP